MAKIIVNLTEKLADQEVEKQLLQLPESQLSDLKAHLDLDLHHSLLVYVLKRLPNHYIVLEENAVPGQDERDFGAIREEQSRISTLISQGIRCLSLSPETDSRDMSSPNTVVDMPSCWFG